MPQSGWPHFAPEPASSCRIAACSLPPSSLAVQPLPPSMTVSALPRASLASASLADEGMTVADDLDELAAALPDGRVSTDPDIVDAYRRDQTTAVTPGNARCLGSTRGTEEVAATVRWAAEHRVPVVPRGGGTGLAGGAAAVDGCVILSLARMNSIVELD